MATTTPSADGRRRQDSRRAFGWAFVTIVRSALDLVLAFGLGCVGYLFKVRPTVDIA